MGPLKGLDLCWSSWALFYEPSRTQLVHGPHHNVFHQLIIKIMLLKVETDKKPHSNFPKLSMKRLRKELSKACERQASQNKLSTQLVIKKQREA